MEEQSETTHHGACMPKKEPAPTTAVQPILTAADRDRMALGGQEGFVHGFNLLASLAEKRIPVPKGRMRTPADTLSIVVSTACTAVNTASRAGATIETDEDFSPLENQLADTLVAIMAASKAHRLRVAQCAAAKLAAHVRF